MDRAPDRPTPPLRPAPCALRREMVTTLVDDGTLTNDRGRRAFLAVPRHVLVPTYYQASERIEGQTDPERWLRLVYSDTTLITQRRLDAGTSSGTMPSLVAMMVQASEIEDGRRVLQVATGITRRSTPRTLRPDRHARSPNDLAGHT